MNGISFSLDKRGWARGGGGGGGGGRGGFGLWIWEECYVCAMYFAPYSRSYNGDLFMELDQKQAKPK